MNAPDPTVLIAVVSLLTYPASAHSIAPLVPTILALSDWFVRSARDQRRLSGCITSDNSVFIAEIVIIALPAPTGMLPERAARVAAIVSAA